jgi:hypothetical protein
MAKPTNRSSLVGTAPTVAELRHARYRRKFVRAQTHKLKMFLDACKVEYRTSGLPSFNKSSKDLVDEARKVGRRKSMMNRRRFP